jgi:hypothetical protein
MALKTIAFDPTPMVSSSFGLLPSRANRGDADANDRLGSLHDNWTRQR